MPQPPTIIDAPASTTVFLGSQLINFPTAGILIAEDLTFTKPLATADFTNQYGQDDKAAYVTKKGTGSMTVQFKTAGMVMGAGELFTFLYQGFATITCVITSVGNVFTQGGAAKCPLTFSEWLDTSPLPQLSVYDGSFATATPTGEFRLSRPEPRDPYIYLTKQEHCQLRATYQSPAVNTTSGPGGAFFVEDSELVDTLGGVVKFDRTWVSIPPNLPIGGGLFARRRYDQGSFAKTYKTIFKQWTNGVISAVSIAARTETIKADIFTDYYLLGENIPALPGVPDAAVNSVGIFIWVDNVNGFPYNPALNSPPNTNNFYHFLSGSIDVWMGGIYVRRTVYG